MTCIDLTPAAIGPYCIPPVNLDEQVDQAVDNVNMVTCGGQATIPMVAAVHRVHPVAYGEIIATVVTIDRSEHATTSTSLRTTAAGIQRRRRQDR